MPEEGEPILIPLTLRSISDSLSKTLSPSEIARFWRGLGQAVRSHARLGGKRYRGVLIVMKPKRLLKEFRKYVVDAADVLSQHLPAQAKLEAYNQA